jgi:hypothetical protein
MTKEYKTVEKLGNGWYSFKDIPQGYIKIDCLNCGNDKQAIKQAAKINKNYLYIIK